MRAAAVAALLSLFFQRDARAQVPAQPVQLEARADLILSRWTAAQAALGLTFPAGTYVRTGLVLGAGDGGRGFDSRIDLFSRFDLDPFRERRWGFYAGGGLSGRYAERDSPKSHAYLLVFIGLEGPLAPGTAGGWVPAFELGLGGGARAGFAIRRGIRGRR